MIEQGIVALVQGDPVVSGIAPIGGFAVQLPKDQVLPSWTHIAVTEKPNYTFKGPVTLRPRRLQIDCYGYVFADCILLGNAIDAVLSGFSGTLSDPDSTFVQGCFRTNQIDFPLDATSRTFRRMLEYELWFEKN